MKGISIITAIALIADISELKRFKDSKKLASYLRSAPGVDSSNENKIDQGKKCSKIRMAICRRVFTESYQMLKKKEYHYYRDERNHTNKMQSYVNFLNSYRVPEKYA